MVGYWRLRWALGGFGALGTFGAFGARLVAMGSPPNPLLKEGTFEAVLPCGSNRLGVEVGVRDQCGRATGVALATRPIGVVEEQPTVEKENRVCLRPDVCEPGRGLRTSEDQRDTVLVLRELVQPGINFFSVGRVQVCSVGRSFSNSSAIRAALS